MTAVLAAVELVWETHEVEAEAEAIAPLETVAVAAAVAPIGGDRKAGAQAPVAAAAGVVGSVWSGIKSVVSAAGKLLALGALATLVLFYARQLWLQFNEFDDSTRERGRVLPFPGPRLQEQP